MSIIDFSNILQFLVKILEFPLIFIRKWIKIVNNYENVIVWRQKNEIWLF